MIIYRLRPDRHVLMYRLFFATSVAEIVGTIFETIIIFWLWGTLWKQWTIPFKVATPILHVLFSVAQLMGAWVFWNLASKEKAIIRAGEVEPTSRIVGRSDGTSGETLMGISPTQKSQGILKS